MPRRIAQQHDSDGDEFDMPPDSPDSQQGPPSAKKKKTTKPKVPKVSSKQSTAKSDKPTPQRNEDKADSDDGEMDLGEEEFASQYEVEDLLKMTIPPPPKPIMEADGSGERLMIKNIVAINFKSYYGRQEIGPFHQNFSSIVGPNGSGKSNVIDAMLFVFGYKSRKIRSKKLSVLIHNSSRHPNIDSCTVEVHFHKIVDLEPYEEHHYRVVEGSDYIVTRTAYKNNTSKYYLDGHTATFKQIGARLRQDGIDLKHNRFLILQGEVEQISLMKPKAVGPNDEGMLEYLEDIIGSSRYKIPIEKFTEKMQELTLQRSQQTMKKNTAEKAKKDLDEPVKEVLRYIRMENDVILKKQKIFTFDKLKYSDRIPAVQAKADEVQQSIGEAETNKKLLHEERSTKNKEEKTLEKEKEEKIKERDSAKKELTSLEAKEEKRKKDLERATMEHKKSADVLAKENKKKKELESVPTKSKKKIEDVEKEITELERKEKINAEEEEKNRPEYEKKSEKLRAERDEIGKELLIKNSAANEASKNLMVAQSDKANMMSAAEKEKSRLTELEAKLKEITDQIELHEKKKKIAEDGLPKYKDNLQKARQEMEDVKSAMGEANNEMDQIRLKLHDAEESLRSMTQGNAVEKLMKKMNGDGHIEYFGRLGDLVSTDAAFDRAISNATNWDVYVVATQEHGKKVLKAIQQNRLPRTNLITMDAVRDAGADKYRPANDQVAPRLFDLLKISDPKFNKVVYQSLKEMRLCDNLNAANNIKRQDPQTYRYLTFVSREGNMIFPNSKISGGGRALTNKVGHRPVDNRSEADVRKMVDELKEKDRQKRDDIDTLKNKMRQLDGQINGLTRDIDKLSSDLKTAEDGLKITNDSCNTMRKRVDEQKKKVEDAKVDQKDLDEKTEQIEELQKVRDQKKAIYDEANERFQKVEVQINNIYESLVGVYKTAKEAATEEMKNKRKEIAKENAAIESSARNLQKCLTRIEQLEKDMEKALETISLLDKVQKDDGAGEEMKERIENIEKEIKEIEGRIKEARNTNAKIDDKELEIDKQIKELKEQHLGYLGKIKQLQGKIDEVDKKLQALKFTLIKDMDLLPEEVKELQNEDEDQLNESVREEAHYAASQHTDMRDAPSADVEGEEEEEGRPRSAHGSRPSSRKGKSGQNDGMEQRVALKPVDLDKIRSMSADDYADLNVKLQQEEAKIAEMKKSIDFTVLEQYKERLAKYQKEAEALREVSKIYNEHNTRLDKFKTERTEEFMAGFVAISLAVREMYQMITMGGDASLEAKDTIDPFSEGIVFMVRPPNKSWKQIENLSGGEKTLSSLALVFALHHYRPTPLYVMDEIDAALDFRNVSIIGRYILNRTSNAQFIVISLRNNMFELAHRLIGIYKVDDCTENCAIDPQMINRKVEKYMGALYEAGMEARKDEFVPASQNLELEDIEPANTSKQSVWEQSFEGEQPVVVSRTSGHQAKMQRKRPSLISVENEVQSAPKAKRSHRHASSRQGKATSSRYVEEEDEDEDDEDVIEEDEEAEKAEKPRRATAKTSSRGAGQKKLSREEQSDRCRMIVKDTPFEI